jgi:non-ribosomal peptide synthetase component F
VTLGGGKPTEQFIASVTYGELKEKSDRLAFRLQGMGIAAGDIAAVMLGRSVEMVIGMLGILKSGAAYLPIDPQYPGDRVRYMMADSNARVLVDTGTLAGETGKPGSREAANFILIRSARARAAG